MKKYILLICLIICHFIQVKCQNTEIVDLDILKYGTNYSETKNTEETYNYDNLLYNEWECYFTLTQEMDITFDHHGSDFLDTYMWILNVNTGVSYGLHEMELEDIVFLTLKPGRYRVISEGGSGNGNIQLNIHTERNNLDGIDGFKYPINIGCINDIYQIAQKNDNRNFTNTFKVCQQNQAAGDIVYKFIVSNTIEESFCQLNYGDSWFSILDSLKNQIAGGAINENTGTQLITLTLPRGTYYLVSTSNENKEGSITTNFQHSFIEPDIAIPSFTIGKNYIVSSTMTKVVSGAAALNPSNSNTSIHYFDGLGRPEETVEIAKSSKDGTTWVDMVNITGYDGYGRDYQQWLPAPTTGNTGSYVEQADFKSGANNFYTTLCIDSNPYFETVLEGSPLSRVLGQKSPGAAWNAHPTGVDYQINIGSSISNYYVNNNLLMCKGAYDANILLVTIKMDEDGKQSFEYKNKLGQVILRQTIDDSDQKINTYYVYNDLGQLCYVLPPMAADNLGTNTTTGYADDNNWLIKYAYLYKYDERGNNIMKRLPGCDYINMVYDKADRLVLSQDGNQRKIMFEKNQWTVIKYDVVGRVIFTGTTLSIDPLKNLQTLVNEFKTDQITESYKDGTGYDNLKFSDAKPLIINYYDTYNFTALQTNGSNLNYAIPGTSFDTKHNSAKGLLTGTRTYILNNNTGTNYTASATYYDHRGRIVQSRSSNHLGGYDIIYNAYDFTGKVVKSLKEHSISSTLSTPTTEIYTYSYDQIGRLLITLYELNHKPAVILASNTKYDELGRLKEKQRHTGADIEEFDYNIRNWATRIKSGAFEEKLYYNTNPVNTTPLFNGNVSYSTWTYNGALKGYAYSYDHLNRLIGSTYALNHVLTDDFYYYMESFAYDKMGNIKLLIRNDGEDTRDQLFFTYNGNQVKNINDGYGSRNQYNIKEYQDKARNGGNTSVVEFEYDKNGNMTTDLDRDIVTIQYNVLNLPEIIQFKNGNQIQNTYDARGQKLSTRYFTVVSYTTQPIVSVGNVYDISDMVQLNDEVIIDGDDYIGNVEYGYNCTIRSGELKDSYNWLKRISNAEGYVDNFNDYIYNYFRRDHLGNNREVWCANTNSTVQRTQYYPSGLTWASNEGDNPGLQERKYNGKEFVEMHGYDTYDYGWRCYYPAIMQFTTKDPLTEKFYSISPYVYCHNNPVNITDPKGLTDTFRSNGTFSSSDGVDNGKILVQVGINSYPLSALDYNNPGTLHAISNIERYFATKMGYDGTIGVAEMNAGGHITPSGSVFLSIQAFKDGNYDNSYNIESNLGHELDKKNGHKSESKYVRDNYTFMDHAGVYFEQGRTSIFTKTDLILQYTVAKGFTEHVWSALKNNDINGTKFKTYIDSFNRKNTGGVNIQFDPDKLENEILDINITVDGESPYGIEAVYRLQEPQM